VAEKLEVPVNAVIIASYELKVCPSSEITYTAVFPLTIAVFSDLVGLEILTEGDNITSCG